MDENFSPKQVAEALRVSESSVKRWCDRGAISTTKTHGGHRRITLDGLLAFMESTNREIANPSAIGLVGTATALSRGTPDSAQALNQDALLIRPRFEEALIRGDERECRKMLAQMYSHHQSFAVIADELIAPSFHRIGELWHASTIEIFQERRACEICVRLIHEFRRLMVEPPSAAPFAIGCTSSGDHYSIPGQLVEVVLREAGWRATNLGANLPVDFTRRSCSSRTPEVSLAERFAYCRSIVVCSRTSRFLGVDCARHYVSCWRSRLNR